MGLGRSDWLPGVWLASCFLCTIASQTAWGGEAGAQRYGIWQASENWQQTAITAVLQARSGYLWLGTYHGLVRYDGVRFTVYDPGNTPELRNGLVTSLFEDAEGVLWIGHETGQLTRFAYHRFTTLPLPEHWPGGAIDAMGTDEQGDLWLLSDRGVLVRARDGHSVPVPGGATASQKPLLAREAAGKLWTICNGTVSLLAHGQLAPFSFPGAQPGDYYERGFAARDGGLWFLQNSQLRHWHDGEWDSEIIACPNLKGVTCLLETRSGTLAAGTLREGLFLLRQGEPTCHFARTNGLSHDWVRALCEDAEGNLWVGTAIGLDQLRPRVLQTLNAPDGWQGCAVLSCALGADGSAWVGTEGAGLYRYHAESWTAYAEAAGISNLYVWSALETRKGQVLVGTFGGGLLVREGQSFRTWPESQRIDAPVRALYEGRHGEVWIGTDRGLHRYERGTIVWSAGTDKLAFPDVRAITESADGSLWFGMSGGGLASLKNGALRQFRKQDGLGTDVIVALCADGDSLWLASSENGLTRLKDGKFAHIGAAQGLPWNVLCHIVDDGTGNLWLSSQRGIFRADKRALHRCAEGQAQTVAFLTYGKADGMRSDTCSGGFQPGATRTPDGHLWFPSAKGVVVVDPAQLNINRVPPPVEIEEVLVEGRALNAQRGWNTETGATRSGAQADSGYGRGRSRSEETFVRRRLEIGPGKQHFEFHYTGLSLAAPDKVRFRYRLEGLESDWTEVGGNRLAAYSYLPPGTYTFRVTACNNDGVWNPSGAALSFMVLPWFWQTWWFQTGSVLSGAGALGAGLVWASRRRLRRELEATQRQQALERERARIARDIHDDLGASLTRITMLSQSIRSELENLPEPAAQADQIYRTARELTRAMDEIVWAVNPRHDTLDSLVTYLGRFAQSFLGAAGIRCRLELPLQVPPLSLSAEVRHNVFLAFKEALHNALRHAHATEVRIGLEQQPGGFVLLVADNGQGFDRDARTRGDSTKAETARFARGNGLGNMQRRLEEIGGRCDWETAPGEGTRVRLSVPNQQP